MRRVISFFTLLSIGLAWPFSTQAQQMSRRSLQELINREEPGWELVTDWIKQAKNKVQILPKTPARADSALLATQVTTRSPMGAVIYETGGILVDNGWLRILGSGSPALDRDLMGWNRGKQQGFLLVADDVLGGFYAINAEAFGQESLGKIFYFAPDTLRWEAIAKSYSEFLLFCFSGNLADYYDNLRWQGWEQEVSVLSGNQGIMCLRFYLLRKEKTRLRASEKLYLSKRCGI